MLSSHLLGWRLTQHVEDILFGDARASDVKNIVVSQINDFRDAIPCLGSRLRLPLAQARVQLRYQSVHDELLPRFQF
jgi:hypothetical protein